MNASKSLKYALCLCAFGFSGCHTESRGPIDASMQKQKACRSQLCDQEFSALVLAGFGKILIRLPGYARFFEVDGRTPESAIRRLAFVSSTNNLDYTAYTGRLEGNFTWSEATQTKVILISRITDVRRLPAGDGKQLDALFEAPTQSKVTPEARK